jgi:hypothetical protein
VTGFGKKNAARLKTRLGVSVRRLTMDLTLVLLGRDDAGGEGQARPRDLDASIPRTASGPADGADCPVCLEAQPASGWRRTRCGHHFCHACAARWFSGSVRCPSCNTLVCDAADTVPTSPARPGMLPEEQARLVRVGLRRMWLAVELYHHIERVRALINWSPL